MSNGRLISGIWWSQPKTVEEPTILRFFFWFFYIMWKLRLNFLVFLCSTLSPRDISSAIKSCDFQCWHNQSESWFWNVPHHIVATLTLFKIGHFHFSYPTSPVWLRTNERGYWHLLQFRLLFSVLYSQKPVVILWFFFIFACRFCREEPVKGSPL